MSFILAIFFVNRIGFLSVWNPLRVVRMIDFPPALNLRIAAAGSAGGTPTNFRSPSFSTYQGETASTSRTTIRRLEAGTENSADFHGKYHLAPGGLSLSNM